MSENNCKKILILGATGPTGILTVQAALERNHIVTIYARTPSKLPSTIFNHPNIKVIRGDLTDTEALSSAIQGQDAIISLLGPAGNVVGTPFTDAYRLIFPLMKRWEVKRILAMGTASIPDENDGFSIIAFLGILLIRILANSAYRDIVSVGKRLRKTDWIGLFSGWGSWENGEPKSSKAGYVGKNGWAMKNQRADVATWLIDEVENDDSEWIRKKPAIWS
ncbi:hypothetical protein N7450_009706 [Penicillium hetheringtonii]|uniref:NAD(P)-binding domain-containing protein n=1 Tax=Penicillium hetheringtonii TaxID=911720 RepID=A0AAD6GLQ6_9EURO|nr:hypothetical protein N7450_009706 [Penicillium hetheringtonii]